MNNLRDLVIRNRSYRRFDESHTIPREILVELVSLARCTASTGNLQPLTTRKLMPASSPALPGLHALRIRLAQLPGNDRQHTSLSLLMRPSPRTGGVMTGLPPRPCSWVPQKKAWGDVYLARSRGIGSGANSTSLGI